MSLRRTVCAWGALAVLVLGGCMMETGEPFPGEEQIGTDSEELVPGGEAPALDPGDDEQPVAQEPEDPTAPPDEEAVVDWGPDRWADPSPDPWMRTARDPADSRLAR